MKSWRMCALVGAALAIGVAACGKDAAAPATTPLPMQSSGLAVGGDVQPQSRDLARTRITTGQLRQIASACQSAVEITGDDPCARSVQEQFKNRRACRPDAPCLIARKTASKRAGILDGSKPAGIVEVVDRNRCGSGPGNVCLRVGVSSPDDFKQVVGTPAPGSPEESGEPTEGSPSPEVSDTDSGPSEPAPGTPDEETPPDENPDENQPGGPGST